MAQDIFSDINPAATSGTQLATYLNAFKAAILSGFSGTTRPAQLAQGGFWVDTTNVGSPNYYLSFKMYTGTNDVEVFRVNVSTNKASISGSDSTFEISKMSSDTTAAILKLIKQRASGTAVADGDIIGEVQFVGRTATATDPVVARIKAVATDNMTTSASGTYLVFEGTPDGTASFAEMMRLQDGKLGVGTQAPDSVIHASGATGIKSAYTADSAAGAKITLSKSRVAGNKSTQNADVIGQVDIRTTDDASAANTSAQIVATATQAHTASAQGTKLDVKVAKTGSATLTTQMTVGDKIETLATLTQTASELVSQAIATSATIAQLDATKAVVEFTGSTATSLQGINSGQATKVILLHNRSTADITLQHENSSATAADRLKLPNSTFVTLRAQTSVELYYSTADSRWKLKSGSGSGTGGGSGVKNYLGTVNNLNGNGDFELGATTGWTLGTTGTLTNGIPTGTPTFGSGASGNLSISASTAQPISGAYSLRVTSSAATVAGNMIASDTVSIESEDLIKVLRGSGYFNFITNYANMNLSGTSSNSLAWCIWDPTNSKWYYPSDPFSFTQANISGTVASQFGGTFQVDGGAGPVSLRFVVYFPNASAGAVTFQLDDLAITQQTASNDGRLISAKATLSATSANFTDNVDAKVLLNSVVADRAGMIDTTNNRFNIGSQGDYVLSVTLNWSTSTGGKLLSYKVNGGSFVYIGIFPSGDRPTATVLIPGLKAGDYVEVWARQNSGGTATIAAGEANTAISLFRISGPTSGDEGRVVAMQVAQATPVATITGSYSLVRFSGTPQQDTHGAYNPSTGLYTVPQSGFYRCSFKYYLISTQIAGGVAGAAIYKNGVAFQATGITAPAITSGNFYPSTTSTVYANAGDTLAPYGLSSGTSNSIGSDASVNYFSVERVSAATGNASANASVSMRYTNTAGTAVGTSDAVLPFPTKDYDSHNSYNTTTGVYTVPYPGKYRVAAGYLTANVTLSTAQNCALRIYKNGVDYSLLCAQLGNGASIFRNPTGTDTVNCIAGDTIAIYANSAVATTLDTTVKFNHVSIERIGN